MHELRVRCDDCQDDFWLEVDAEFNGGPAGRGWAYRLPDVVRCPECDADCTAAAERATGDGPTADDLADMKYGV